MPMYHVHVPRSKGQPCTLVTDDQAPRPRKTLWLATFYLCIPVGFALGYVLGGVVHGALGWHGDWRVAFLLVSGAMAPFVVFLLLVRDPLDLAGTLRCCFPC